MASVNRDKKGWRVEFTLNGDRKNLRLGGANEKTARAIGAHVERILDSRRHGLALAAETEGWIGRLSGKLRQQLINCGLVANSGSRPSRCLGVFVDAYIADRTDLKGGSVSNMKTASRWLKEFFGVDRDMSTISAGDADKYRVWLRQSQAENTVRRLCSRAKQFFRAAVRQRLISENPFADMKKLAVGASPDRRITLIDRAKSEKVMRACPDAEWRLIFALARFAGVRCPSEIVPLRWSDIDWKRNRMVIQSVKTEHHEGHASRIVPLFPEVAKALKEWQEESPVDSEWIISRTRSSKTNLRTQLTRIIEAAGLKPWPKLFQNLRATRETELMQNHPLHVVCSWMGNTPKVAARHYLQVTEADFERATASTSERQAG